MSLIETMDSLRIDKEKVMEYVDELLNTVYLSLSNRELIVKDCDDNPVFELVCLYRIIGNMTISNLRELSTVRQLIITNLRMLVNNDFVDGDYVYNKLDESKPIPMNFMIFDRISNEGTTSMAILCAMKEKWFDNMHTKVEMPAELVSKFKKEVYNGMHG